MVLQINRYEILNGERPWGINPVNVVKMSNEEAQELGFNIYSPKEWKEWLQTSKVNRKRAFPRSGNGRLYAYHVMFWGAPKEVPKEARKGGQYTLFPGYDSNGKRYNLALYGVLDM